MGPPPHGGALVDLRVEEDRAVALSAAAKDLPAWELTRRQRCDLELVATGGFSPLRTFLDRDDYESVCTSMRLTTGELWPVPVVLDLPETVVEAASAAGGLALRARGEDLAVVWFRSAWRPDRTAEALSVLGTTDPTHPGVHALLYETHPWYVSGPLEVLGLPRHHAFGPLRHTPAGVRSLLVQRGWGRVVAFQTRNPMHRAHQELTIRAARDLDANLLLHPVVGVTKPGDVDPYVRVRCYRALLPTYPPGTALLSLLPLAMRMAGPREALWHAIVRKNHGATHFIVGRDHAGPGMDLQGRPFYEPYAAQELVREHERELGIGVVPFRQMVYVDELRQYVPEDEVQPGHHCLRISGTEQRRRLAEGEELPSWFTPPEVAAELRRAFPARSRRGVCVLIRATLPEPRRAAAAVGARLREAGRTVTVIDDAVPADAASSSLVIGLVGDVMRNGGAVVCSGEAATHVGERGPGLARCGLVLDVVDAAEEIGPGAVQTRVGERARAHVAAGATAEAVGEIVCHRLGQLGYVSPDLRVADEV
ncbi:sulfate adenylyltransferase [Geodermatophilus sp. SYSU D00703]